MRPFMKIRLIHIIFKAAFLHAVIMLGGCASGERLITLSPVGPKSNSSPGGDGPGHLVVYNTSHETLGQDGAMAYPHDDYKILDGRHDCIKRVRNVSGAHGEIPTRVDLPPGQYTVIAHSEVQGSVAVPVTIESGLATRVDLQYPARIIRPNSTASN